MATLNPVNIGSAPNDGAGDAARTAFGKINTDLAAINAELATVIANLASHTHAQLHNRLHQLTSAADHSAGLNKMFFSDGTGAIQEGGFGAAGTMLGGNGPTVQPSFRQVASADIVNGAVQAVKLNADVFASNGDIFGGVATDKAVHPAGLKYASGVYWPLNSRTAALNFTQILNTQAGSLIKTDRNMTLHNAITGQKAFMLWNVDVLPHTLTITPGAGGTGQINGVSAFTIGPGGVVAVFIESNTALDQPQGAAFGDITPPIVFERAFSDETTPLTVGTAKLRFRMPFAMYLTGVRFSVTNAPTGAPLIIDIMEGVTPVSILSTKLSIDAGEETSVSAASQAVISDPNLADNGEIRIDVLQIGSTIAGTGGKICMYGWRL